MQRRNARGSRATGIFAIPTGISRLRTRAAYATILKTLSQIANSSRPSVRQILAALLVSIAVTCGNSANVQAQLPTPQLPNPRLNWVFPAGGKVGATFDVTVDGFDLDDGTKLHFDHPGIAGVPKLGAPELGQTGPQTIPNVYTVTIPPDVKPGIYEVRVLGKYGLSSPRAFAVGTQPEINETEPNNSFKQANPVQIGTTINGVVKETTTDYFKFSATKGQRVIIDCNAFRIDSQLAAALVLYDASGRELDRNRHANRRDAMLDFTVPEDGEYVIGIHDFVYGYYMLPGYCFYRLSISTAPYLDFIFPPAGLAGTTGPFTLYGRNLPGGQPTPEMTVGGKSLEKLTINLELPASKAMHLGGDLLVAPSEAFIDGIEYRLDSPTGLSNPVLVSMAGAPVVMEQEPNNDPSHASPLKLPCEVAGQFYPPGDQDWFTFEAKKGDVLWIEVISQRLGLPTDPHLLVQQIKTDDKGNPQISDISVVDDMQEVTSFVHWSFLSGVLFNTSTHDPACRFVAPAKGTYRILVRDMAKLADSSPRSVYRLLIRPPQPDFRLVAVPRPPTAAVRDQGALNISQSTVWSPVLQRGGSELIEVFAIRRDGFEGEIRVSADNLPPGVTCAPAILSPIAVAAPVPVKRSTTLVLKATDDAPASISSLSIKGQARIGDVEIIREARTGSMIWPTMQNGVTYPRSRLVRQLALTVDQTEIFPFTVEVASDLVLETSRAGTLKFPVKVTRRADFKGPLMLHAYGLPLFPGNVVHSQPLFCKPTELKGDQETTEFMLEIPPYAPTGISSFFLSGVGTVKYARNPQALLAAQERKAVLEKIVAEDAARVVAATAAQAEAEKKRVEPASSAEDLKIATDAKAAADKTLAEADAKAKQSAAFLQTFAQEFTKLQEKSKPTDLTISAATTTITLKISDAPISIETSTIPVVVKQGTKQDLSVQFKRLYGYAEPVQIALRFSPAASGIGIPVPNATIPPEQTQGSFTIDAAPTAMPGPHTLIVTATATIKGQSVSTTREISIIVEKTESAKLP